MPSRPTHDHSQHHVAATPSTTRIAFHIPELTCPDELALLERGLRPLPGIADLHADYLGRRLFVSFDADEIDALDIRRQIERIGLHVADPPEGLIGVSGRPTLPAAATFVGGLCLVAAAAVRLSLGETTTAVALLAIASTVLSGIPVARAALRALRVRMADMHVLMTIAGTGAIAIGDYFEAATTMFLFGVALWLESYTAERTRRAVHSLVALAPTVAHRLEALGGERTTDVDPAELAVGDLIVVRPGERFPIDGVVAAGASAVDQSPITGESVPLEKEPGDQVFAGSINSEGVLTVRATCTAEEDTLAHIARMVAQAHASRSPMVRFVDAFAQRYTPAVLALAVVVAAVPPLLAALGVEWAAALPASEWVHRGLVLLVIACPCALVISTPVTLVTGLFAAAHRGILIKGGEHLEKTGRLDAVVFDKTGTLTTGRARVVAVEAAEGYSTDLVLSLAAALEQQSDHPHAKAIVAAAEARGLTIRGAEDVVARRGFGVEGGVDGQRCLVGNLRLIEREAPAAAWAAADLDRADETTSAFVATPQAVVGVVRLADPPREDAAEAVAALRKMGLATAILTGDRAAAARGVASRLGIEEIYAELLPADKVDCVGALARRHRCLAMVGDGVNDAPALAAAHLGVALGSQASATALETADVVVMTPRLGRVAELARLGRRCRWILGENITLSLALKAGFLVLAAMGMATMWMAVAADMGASLAVTLNGLRLARPS